jgi:hypothetical protein
LTIIFTEKRIWRQILEYSLLFKKILILAKFLTNKSCYQPQNKKKEAERKRRRKERALAERVDSSRASVPCTPEALPYTPLPGEDVVVVFVFVVLVHGHQPPTTIAIAASSWRTRRTKTRRFF